MITSRAAAIIKSSLVIVLVCSALGGAIANSSAATIVVPVPAPSFTNSTQTAAVVATTFGVIAGSTNYPDPTRPEEINGRVVTNQPQAVRVISSLGDSGWVDTTMGWNFANPLNIASVHFGMGINARDQQLSLRIYLAPSGSAPDITDTYPLATTVTYNALPGQASAYVIDGGACSQVAQIGQPNRPLNTIKQVIADNPNMFVHMGDTTYVDTWKNITQGVGDDPATYSKFAFGARSFYAQPDINALFSKVLARVVLDDHDTGPDNDYATNVYPSARQVYTDAFATNFNNSQFDINSLLAPASVNYDTFYLGSKTQAWVLDNRLWADHPGTKPNGQTYASQLGLYQLNWLRNTLAASTKPIKIIYSPRSFTQSYQGGEQKDILAVMKASLVANPNSRIIIVSGDTHAAAVWQISDPRIQEYLSGPLFNTTKHSVHALSTWQINAGYVALYNDDGGIDGRALYNVYNRIAVDEATGNLTVNIVAEDGTVIYGQTFTGL